MRTSVVSGKYKGTGETARAFSFACCGLVEGDGDETAVSCVDARAEARVPGSVFGGACAPLCHTPFFHTPLLKGLVPPAPELERALLEPVRLV